MTLAVHKNFNTLFCLFYFLFSHFSLLVSLSGIVIKITKNRIRSFIAFLTNKNWEVLGNILKFEDPGWLLNKVLSKLGIKSKPGVVIYTELLSPDAHPSYTPSYETQWAGEHTALNFHVQIAKMGIDNLLIYLSRACEKLTRLKHRQLSAGWAIATNLCWIFLKQTP